MVRRTAIWLKAFRLHTLPLAMAAIALGNALAYTHGQFDGVVAILSFTTAIALQILSNLANDYGDTLHGADSSSRKGPQRAVQSGEISVKQIKAAILLFIIICLTTGVLLLIASEPVIGLYGVMSLFILGLIAIAAAIAYTATKKPYGYRGYGDISVFVFFGLLAVYGSYYLQTGALPLHILMPAAGMGLLCTAVLNVNNTRDIEADLLANKITVAVKLGLRRAKAYHWVLLISAIALFLSYTLLYESRLLIWFMLPAILFIVNGYGVSNSDEPAEINPYLKQLVISILIFTLSYGAGLVILNGKTL